MKCVKCKTELSGEKFCPDCGERTQAVINDYECPECGKTIELANDELITIGSKGSITINCPYCDELLKFTKSKVTPVHSKKRKTSEKPRKGVDKKKIILGIAGLVIVFLIVFFAIPFNYTATEQYSVQEPHSAKEYYTEWVDSKNCDYEVGCSCKHHSWAGLGACDSCKCTRSRTVTKYETVKKERQVTKKATLYNQAAGNVRWYYTI